MRHARPRDAVRGTAARGAAHRRPLLAVPAVAAALIGGAVVGVDSPAVAADDGVTIEIVDVSPAYVAPGQTLSVRGVVHNGTDTALDEAAVTLRLQSRVPRSRQALNAWLDTSVTYRSVAVADAATDVRPGASREVSLTVAADDLGLPVSAWGPRGLELRVTGTSDGSTARDRTHLVWAPETSASPTSLALVVPVAPTAAEWQAADDEGTSVDVTARDRVDDLVAATAATPSVAWALDPALLAGPDPAVAGGPTTAIRAGAQDRDVVALPFADADAAAITHAEQAGLLTAAVDRGVTLRGSAGIAALPGVTWPAGPAVDLDTVEVLQGVGARAVVVPGDQMATVRELTYTPTGRATITTADGDVAALLSDTALSAALAGGRTDDPSSDPAARALDARQYLLATTAMITAERPNDPRAVLAAAPRTLESGAAALGDRIRTVLGAPWVSPMTLTAFAAVPAPDLARVELPDEVVIDGEASKGLMRMVQGERARLLGFAQVVPDPESLVRVQDDALLAVTSTAWREDADARATFAADATGGVVELMAALGVEDSSTVNLISASGDLPINVRNDLDQPVTAALHLVVSDPALQVPESVPVELPADAEEAVSVPVRAVGSADVTIRAELVNAAGATIGTPATLEVRVRADWENVGTAVVAGGVGVLLVLGLVRSIRRGRRHEPPAAGGAA